MVNLVVVIGPTGFSVTRIPDDPTFVKPVTMEMQIQDPKLGVVTEGDALSNLLRAINEGIKEATGTTEDTFVFNPELK